jgi:enoyl-CoA hydratase
MNAGVLTTHVADGIAVITLGTARRIYIDQETSDALFEALNACAGDADIRVVIVTGAAPGSFVRHYSIPELIRLAESVRATGREWAISGTCLAGAFELTLACDLRIAEDGDYQIGFPETNFGLCPGAGGTQRLPRTIGTAAALMHILMGVPVSPREAERRGLVHETVSGKALDRAMEVARHLSSFTAESLAYIKRLVRGATETPLAQGLLLERRLFMKLCLSDAALSRMRAYDEQDSASPSRVT